MPGYEVILSPGVQAAIVEQGLFIAFEADAPVNADRWIDSVEAAIEALAEHPHRHQLLDDDGTRWPLRQLVVGSHLVLFRVDEVRRRVLVVGFRHGHRLPPGSGAGSATDGDDQ